ncbi:MAG TPA: type I DNA topoisomerase [Deltaproteobacteria bacterium]|nr:type I DNA topoisomerase [Deltaproteobacteria bacterium]HPR56309.1 type I DNA topoisomerase [Deltaproteobacteria bacterium]HXK46467.1 type I DNA topoisomerase [Deltaproteobacteria bacterium]
MAKSLVIVESPAKARTIKRYLGKGFEVEATMGHIKDLPKSKLGIEIEQGFSPSYKVIPDKRDVVKKIKGHADKADIVYLASDPDREGEAIAWHVAEEIRKPDTAVRRITFHEITKKAIEEALKNPKELNRQLYDAQMARRSMDRIVGYTMSPLLWKKVKRGLSGGRVQSVALRLICMRQEEIESFTSREYWTVEATLQTPSGDSFTAKVILPKEIPDELTASKVVEAIRSAPAILIRSIARQVRAKNPLPPFITSTLQQASSSKLRFSAKKTMMIAQQLYEGLPIGGDEITGLITYMRTDSPVVSEEAMGEVRRYIPEVFGQAYLPEKPRRYKAKKTAQEAHEAIRPTSLLNTPEALRPYLSDDQYTVYDLIWKRFIASQMSSASFNQTTVDIAAGDIGLRSSGSVMTFDGFLKIYDTNGEEDESTLPDTLNEGDRLACSKLGPEQHFTQPPPRYTEASLIKELEEKGIGRPSTYAPTLSTIVDRGYVRMESRSFVPTELGRDVNSLLVKHYPNILDIGFTAKMEDSLDLIEEGQSAYEKVMGDFFRTYNTEHEQAAQNMENIRAEARPSGILCETCGKDMLIKLGRNGYFLGCAGYPDCTNTKEFARDESGKIVPVEEKKAEETGETCEKCGSPMVVKRGRFGQFLACSNYPECKNTKRITKAPEPTDRVCDKCGAQMVIRQGRFGPFLACSAYPKCKNIMPFPLGVKCPMPGCTGEIVQQRSKKGKSFYSCSLKECKFISWTKPVIQECPRCGSGILIRKGTKLTCANPECSHSEDALS